MFNDLVDVNYTMQYVPGKENHLPDFLSRANSVDVAQISNNLTALQSNINWQAEQDRDETLFKVKSILNNHVDRSVWFGMKNGKRWWAERHLLYISNGILMHSNGNRVIVPVQLRNLILHTHHDIPLAGHRAAETTLNSIKDRYFWFNMVTETIEYCSSCKECQNFNYINLQNVAP